MSFLTCLCLVYYPSNFIHCKSKAQFCLVPLVWDPVLQCYPGRNPTQDPIGFSRILYDPYEILHDPVRSHRILHRNLNGNTLIEILYRILQDFLGSCRILQDPLSSHRILPRIPNGNNPNHVDRILLRIL